jgi:hypothetical protein
MSVFVKINTNMIFLKSFSRDFHENLYQKTARFFFLLKMLFVIFKILNEK